jgi:hypothetical protein
MQGRRISRRHLLQGLAGTVGAVGLLPLLDVEQANADIPTFPKRLIIVGTHQGTIYGNWLPRDATGTTVGSETDFHFPDTFIDTDPSPSLAGTTTRHILSPLTPFKKDLLVLGGINDASMMIDKYKEHYKAMCHLLTSTAMGPGLGFDQNGIPIAGWAGGMSVDQLIASRIGQGNPFLSLEMGVRTSTGSPTPYESDQVLSYAGVNQPLPNQSDPVKNYAKIFGNFQLSPSELSILRERRRSVVDSVQKNFVSLRPRLGSDDRTRLDHHWDRVRELERQLDIVTDPSQNCVVPTLNLPPNYHYFKQAPLTASTNIDLLVMALACDLTRVATFQLNIDTWEFLNIDSSISLHDRTHIGWASKGNKDWLLETHIWHSQVFASLLEKLAAIPEGNGTLLDNCAVVWINELGDASVHKGENIPVVIAGGCGGYFKTGRFINYTTPHTISGPASWPVNPISYVGETHSNLLLSLLHAFDQPDASFGDPAFCSGGLSGLTG